MRDSWEWSKNNVYVYSGSFGLYGLNKNYLKKLISLISLSDSNSRFLFLLSNSEEEFNFFIRGLDRNIFKYFSVEPENLYKYLSAADVGIHALPPQIDSFTRLGTKIVEYWACGLPTLLNDNVGEASHISKKNNFGLVIDSETLEHNRPINLDFSMFDRSVIRKKSLELFEKNKVLNSYMRIYKKIMKSNNFTYE